MREIKFEELEGKTIIRIEGAERHSESIIFETTDGKTFAMYHSQDCCESVSVEDVAGDIADLIGTPILSAEEVASDEPPPDAHEETLGSQDSFTWTFYKLSTIKGSVTIRWYGESNGYYSESVDFVER